MSMKRDRVRYSKVTLKDGTMNAMCVFYTNIACRASERGQIEADIKADFRELGLAYDLYWTDEPVALVAGALR